MKKYSYVLITAAYNAEKTIENTILSVANQSHLPKKWIIANDGSSDSTEYIINKYKNKYSFIELFNISGENKHSFASKVFALKKAINFIKGKKYDYIGIVDSDVSFGANYFNILISRMSEDSALGIAGGDCIEFVQNKLSKRIKSPDSVAGATQFFKQKCFFDTIDFLPLEFGGEDSLKEISARMKGWRVQTFFDLEVIHHGYVGGERFLRSRYRTGIQHQIIGYHPLFYFFRCVYRIKERPFLIGSVAEFFGFLYAKIAIKSDMVPDSLKNFLRNEQMEKLKNFLIN
jgi:glycosyltransferase involved in cell wall biosynthesis